MGSYFSSNVTSNRKRKALDALEENIIPSKRSRFNSTYRHQNFSLPDSIMYYITKNPSTPKGYQSIIQTCKYFFHKNSIILYSNVYFTDKEWQACGFGEWKYSNDLAKGKSRIWITTQFYVHTMKSENRNIVSSLIPKFYHFNVKRLIFTNQVISFNDYLIVSSAAEYIRFKNVIIKDKNDSIVALEKIVEVAVKVKFFVFFSDTALTNITTETVHKLFENPNFTRLKCLDLNQIPQIFDIEAFYGYMKKNISTKFSLIFDASISDAYKNRLDAIIDEILLTKKLDYIPPIISFFGIDNAKLKSLCYNR